MVAYSYRVRAWQAHAPGQSLPQGLAAGYSRIHALPPPVIASPSTPGGFSQTGYSPGTKAFGHAQSPPGDWHHASPGSATAFDSLAQFSAQTQGSGNGSLGGLESVFSRLSYSAAATRTYCLYPDVLSTLITLGCCRERWHRSRGRWQCSARCGRAELQSPRLPQPT